MTEMVTIDGSHGEGGGQVLRTSLSLSAITGRPVEIVRIRAGRSKPGLQPQHLAAVRAAVALCDAGLDGASVGATRLTFVPSGPARPARYQFDIGTAGAAPLVMQTVLLPLALSDGESQVTVTGGTYVPHAPTADYLEDVYAALLRRQGLDAVFASPGAGFFPKGGGILEAKIAPSSLRPVTLTERGKMHDLTAHIVTSGLPPDVGARGEAALREHLRGLPGPLTVQRREAVSPGPGAAIVLVAETDGSRAGFSATGERGKPMERVADEACAALRAWWDSGAACEAHLADQLVLPMALVAGTSRWTTSAVTEHLRTVLWVVSQFLPGEATLDEHADGSGTVTVTGIAHG